jgi:hypothetical protein
MQSPPHPGDSLAMDGPPAEASPPRDTALMPPSPTGKKKTHWWSINKRPHEGEAHAASPPRHAAEDKVFADRPLPHTDEPVPLAAIKIQDDEASERSDAKEAAVLAHTLSGASIKSAVSTMTSGKWGALKTLVQDPDLLAAIKRELTINLDETGLERPTEDDLRSFKSLFNRHLHCTLGKSMFPGSTLQSHAHVHPSYVNPHRPPTSVEARLFHCHGALHSRPPRRLVAAHADALLQAGP